MKKIVVTLLFVLIFLFPLIASADIDISNNLSSGETAIVKISGNFLDQINLDNVKFYRGHVQTYFDYNIGKIDDTYYVYFQTLNKPLNNYSINISGVRYYAGADISNDPFSKQFSVNSEIADFKINPGIIVTDGNFLVEIQNLQSFPITVTLDTETTSGSTSGFFDILFKKTELSSQKSFELSSGEISDLDVFLEGINETTARSITLSSQNTEYVIPVYLVLQSSGEQTTENTTIDYNQSAQENDTSVTESTKNESEGSFWDIFKSENKTETDSETDGYELITDEEGNEILVDDKGDVVAENISLKSCSQLNGDLCVLNEEVCDGTKVNALNGECCIGTCIQKEKSDNGKIVGWAIIGLIVILLIFFKIKLNKTKRKQVNLLKLPKRR